MLTKASSSSPNYCTCQHPCGVCQERTRSGWRIGLLVGVAVLGAGYRFAQEFALHVRAEALEAVRQEMGRGHPGTCHSTEMSRQMTVQLGPVHEKVDANWVSHQERFAQVEETLQQGLATVPSVASKQFATEWKKRSAEMTAQLQTWVRQEMQALETSMRQYTAHHVSQQLNVRLKHERQMQTDTMVTHVQQAVQALQVQQNETHIDELVQAELSLQHIQDALRDTIVDQVTDQMTKTLQTHEKRLLRQVRDEWQSNDSLSDSIKQYIRQQTRKVQKNKLKKDLGEWMKKVQDSVGPVKTHWVEFLKKF